MPSLKDIRKRISSVKNTQQITRAMKLVSAAKLRRATESALAARPYAMALDDMLKRLAEEEVSHPLMEVHDTSDKSIVVVVTSDRGLCGSFNAALLRKSEEWVRGRDETLDLRLLGRKARDFFLRRKYEPGDMSLNREPADAYDEARAMAAEFSQLYVAGKVDEVWLHYNRFVSVMTQQPEFVRILPIGSEGLVDPSEGLVASEEEKGKTVEDKKLLEMSSSFVFEPGKEDILEQLLPLYLETRIYQVFLESVAGEFAARMRAMDSATRNAGELIQKLTTQYNRARQAAITKELVEIISGAEAL